MCRSIFNALNILLFSLICADPYAALSHLFVYPFFCVSLSWSLSHSPIHPCCFFVILPLHLCVYSVSVLSLSFVFPPLSTCFSLVLFFLCACLTFSLLSLLYSSFISFPLFLFFPIPLVKVDNNLWIQVELHFWNRTLMLEPIKLDSEKWEKS